MAVAADVAVAVAVLYCTLLCCTWCTCIPDIRHGPMLMAQSGKHTWPQWPEVAGQYQKLSGECQSESIAGMVFAEWILGGLFNEGALASSAGVSQNNVKSSKLSHVFLVC